MRSAVRNINIRFPLRQFQKRPRKRLVNAA